MGLVMVLASGGKKTVGEKDEVKAENMGRIVLTDHLVVRHHISNVMCVMWFILSILSVLY